jgi:D-3-phosphoglycerate dehydrogenase / 2-oxoglutarate reductase
MALRLLNMADVSACPDLFDRLGGEIEVTSLPADKETLRARISEFDAYFASLQVRVDRDVLDRATRLSVIATPSTGLDHLDLVRAAERGIAILSLKDDLETLGKITATAEMAWTLLLSVARHLPWAFDAARKGDWARDRFRGLQLSGKTLGILGYGRLGRMVAEYGKAFRMRVLACDRKDVVLAEGVERADFDRLLRESDVLSLHIHLSEENWQLLDARAFDKMKRGAILINTSRGGIVDEEAMLKALLDRRLGGAGLDVIDGEWRDDLSDHPLVRYASGHQNLVISPHVGGVTVESQRMAFERTLEKLVDYLSRAGPR